MSTPVLGQCDGCGQHDVPITYDGPIWACVKCEPKAAHVARRAASTEQTALGVVFTNALDDRIEHKIMVGGEAKTAVLAQPITDVGEFTGYLAAFGRDHGGDTLMPGSMTETVAAFNAGRIRWHLTDAHSAKASDVVATVTAAAVDHHGLRIAAAWMPTERAQALRAMVRSGAKLGLSIDYFSDVSRPDGAGGRFLDKVTVVGGAITPKPMNAAATITEGKHAAGGFAQVLTVGQAIAEDAARRERESPQRRAQDAMLAAASWPPPGLFDRETSLALIRNGAEAKARRELAEGDPARARAQAARDRRNAYSTGLRETMTRLAAEQCPHRGCMPGRCSYR